MLFQAVSTIPEMLAMILLLILLAFSVSDHIYAARRAGLFSACLLLSIMATACSLGLMAYQQTSAPLPVAVYTLALLGQFFTSLAVSLTGTYALAEIYAGAANRRSFRIARIFLWASCGCYMALCAFNHHQGLLFTVDDAGTIHNGPLAWFIQLVYGFQVTTILINYIFHRKETDPGFHHVMIILPFLTAALVAFQAFTPPLMLDGIALAMVLLLMLVCCQRQRVNRDHLTTAGSREALSALMERMIAARQPFTLQQVSLVHFRRVNRRFGLEIGDGFLREVTRAIMQICPNDQCFRFNGTDFIIFHDHLPDQDSEGQLHELRERFSNYWECGGSRTLLGATFAQVSYPAGGDTAEDLINNLEYCHLRARDLPDSAVVIYDDQVRRQIAYRERINDLIASSLSTNRFFLCYQPIFDANGEKPCGAEALLRLRDMDGSVVSPGVFIPAAEENGSIIQVTWMVLDKVCAFLDSHREENLPPISINFSAQQFAEQDMCAVIRRYLDYYRIQPRQIKIEITERVFTEMSDMLRQNITGLQDMGVGLYLDDFGTGYSNLASVLNYPIEVVKVDKSLLHDISDVKANDLLQALISGLKHLDVDVLMEGVETSEQSARMQSIGVDRMQGFYYARPMEEKDFLSYMTNNNVA